MKNITLSHGAGGRLMHELIDSLFIKVFANDALRQKRDSAIVEIGGGRIAFTTDSYVVNPIIFPGGDIGSLAVYGTVNDLSVCGAKPLYISLGLIIEEGFEKKALERIVASIERAARRAGVQVVTGDTKVVEKGACDKIFINTSGIGEIFYIPNEKKICSGDVVIVSGPIGDHAISVLSKREGIAFKTTIRSDSAPLNGLIARVLKASSKVRFMRDPTRGGLATTLNEAVERKSFGILLNEKSIPVRSGVKEACELLGFDPLYCACEGRVVMIVAQEGTQRVMAALRRDVLGKSASVIGAITKEYKGKVILHTAAGGKRIVDMLTGEQLPRIC